MASIAEALELALQLHGKGRLDDAEILYGRILDADADNPQALYLLGTLLCQRARFGEARPLLDRAAALRPDSVSVHLTLARMDVQAGGWASALARTRRALALDPAEHEAWDALATGERQAAPDTAVTALARAHRAAPRRADLGRKLGLLLHERGRKRLSDGRAAAAMADLSVAFDLLPPDPELGFALAAALTAAGRPQEALTLHRRLVAWFPAESRVSHNLGVALLRAGRREAAAAVLSRAATLDPENAEPCEALAEAFGQSDPDRALA